MIKGVLFDAGNTLVLFDCEYVSQAVMEAGYSVPPVTVRAAEYRARFAIDCELLRRMERQEALPSGTASMHASGLWQVYFSTLLGLLGIAEDRRTLIVEKLLRREKASARGLWHRLEPGLRLVLSELRHRGYRLGVVSNSDGRLRDKFNELQLTQYFDFILDSDEVGIEKPDVRLFHLGLQRSGLAAEEALYIGDLYTVDVLAARRAGIHALLYDPAGLYHDYEPTVIRWWSDLLRRLPRLIFAEAERSLALGAD